MDGVWIHPCHEEHPVTYPYLRHIMINSVTLKLMYGPVSLMMVRMVAMISLLQIC